MYLPTMFEDEDLTLQIYRIFYWLLAVGLDGDFSAPSNILFGYIKDPTSRLCPRLTGSRVRKVFVIGADFGE